MPPKKKGGKGKKKDDSAEPPHDGSWERTVENGTWEKPATDLPDANVWPTWGALRERVLMACKEIKIVNTASLRDAFCNEIVKLSPPELATINFQGSSNLRNFVVSPMAACPKLTELDLSDCSSLEYVMLQSPSLRTLRLKGCQNINKVLIHCPHLTSLEMMDNPRLETIMIWSDELVSVDLSGCTGIYTLKLQCPALQEKKVPPLRIIEQHVKPVHPPISFLLKETYSDASKEAAEAKEREWKSKKEDSVISKVYRPF
ncbi:hypothetical protein CEUSTIGMA_g2115.t1 [Chlamydomonas eustigma]|uniref:Uncharacterized protein n=1 Tax=Chlamydomonas eustigma TaxID=1157962 RepID=A0A250WV03_9CHLO|nr:hypothetical protein CEUSTIGMA_g2115.t1 [Chlamydomonas eustigma]|eukprot:GAX74667.1 hypothetical protein CEUSTIGMA_g2115.t1 [Chlamydomonas eustigma]